MKKMIMLVGPPGSGKSTKAKEFESQGYTYINQDLQGVDHITVFDLAIIRGEDVVVDRMNFNKQQRNRYLTLAKTHQYHITIIVLHESYKTCLDRCLVREGHATIKNEKSARGALQTFFTKYERVEDCEADVVVRVWPEGVKDKVIWSDIDGTVALVDHRRHFVNPPPNTLFGPVELYQPLPKFKKDWNGFFKAMVDDQPNLPVIEILERFSDTYPIVYCSGRPENYKKETTEWLEKHCPPGALFMRNRSDSRQDDIVKGIILEFEIKTRYDVLFCLDDRDQVVKMLRSHGLNVFQVADGNF